MTKRTHTATRTELEQWRRSIRSEYAQCYWPGPWTMEDIGRVDQMLGRDDDARDVTLLVRDTKMVVLSGESGVGKSSLLQLKVLPALRREGFVALVCRSWDGHRADDDGASGMDGISAFLTGKLRADLDALDLDPGDDLIGALDDRYGNQAVIVLDQFEEVIRQQPELFDEIRTWIESVIARTRVRFVLSLRSEYVHRLSSLRVGAYQRVDAHIDPIQDVHVITEIVRGGRVKDDAGVTVRSDVIEPDAVTRLADLWRGAGGERRLPRIGLLHVQAALFLLWRRVGGERTIDLALVDDLYGQSRSGRPADAAPDPLAFFEWALSEVVSLHLDVCVEKLRTVGQSRFDDSALEEGVRGILLRMAGFLSSGGYKVGQDRVHLAELVLREEWSVLGFAEGEARERAYALLRNFAQIVDDEVHTTGSADWVSAPRSAIAPRLGIDRAAAAADTSAGPAMGLSAEAVLFEEYRRYFFALEWLSAGELIRLSPGGDGSVVVTLSHDGFGRGLNDWAQRNSYRPESAIYRLTATLGTVFAWPVAQSLGAENLLDGSQAFSGHRTFVNLRWRSCEVRGASIRNVAFLNCDFRGTTFSGCRFEGVTFVNCLLDGVAFDGCEIVGSAQPLEHEELSGVMESGVIPSFVAKDDIAEVVAMLNRYGDDALTSADVVFSATSGVPGVPAILDAAARDQRTSVTTSVGEASVTASWEPQSGGLVMFGGRISSLAFYGCRFPDDGVVSLRRVAGTSLDLLEHGGGRVELYDVAIRGLTISPSVLVTYPGIDNDPAPLVEVVAVDSRLENVWFSAGLKGAATIRNSVVWQMFSGSAQGPDGFDVCIDDDSPFGGLVNAKSHPGIPALRVPFGEAATPPEVLAEARREAGEKIDYRSLTVQAALRDRLRLGGAAAHDASDVHRMS